MQQRDGRSLPGASCPNLENPIGAGHLQKGRCDAGILGQMNLRMREEAQQERMIRLAWPIGGPIDLDSINIKRSWLTADYGLRGEGSGGPMMVMVDGNVMGMADGGTGHGDYCRSRRIHSRQHRPYPLTVNNQPSSSSHFIPQSRFKVYPCLLR